MLTPMTDTEFRRSMMDHFLGKGWYVVDPLGPTQVNAIAAEDIKNFYPSVDDGLFTCIKKYFIRKYCCTTTISKHL